MWQDQSMATSSPAITSSVASQDALDALLGDVLPRQGAWSDEEYLWLTDRAHRPVELTDGRVELLPMPTDAHQVLLLFLYRALYAHIQEAPRRGLVVTSGLRMRVRAGKFREPDLLLLRDRSDPRRRDATGSAPISSRKSSAPTIRLAILSSSAPTTPRRPFPNTGSSIPASTRSPSSSSLEPVMSSMAYSLGATRRPRRCSMASRSM